LMNLEVPKEYGGAGLGVLDAVLILEELNYGCAGIANAFATSARAAVPLVIAGSDEQKPQYLRQLTQEFTLAAGLCGAGWDGGTDGPEGIVYRPVGNEYVLTGSQQFVSNGTLARWYTAFASPTQGAGLACFVFPAGLPGIRKQRMPNALGQRAAD